MSNSIEIEAKALISKSDYELLIDTYKEYGMYTQTNHYIDTENRVLKSNLIALRAREKNGSLELTLKVPLEVGLLEINHTITQDEFISFKDNHLFPKCEIKDRLDELGVNTRELRIYTSLTTTRTDVPYKGGTLSIDKNEYSGITDYEIELEGNEMDSTIDNLRTLLDSFKIPFVENKVHKIERALKAIGK
ncbi:MAG: CYTH domain-containing protein [Bacilli bacterium]|nr:CYTH domain-containing protein [Bacilli bacterium]